MHGNIYTIKCVKYNLDHKITILHSTWNGRGFRFHPSRNRSEMKREQICSLPSSSHFPFLLPAPTIPLSFWFFLLFVGVLRPNQQFWHLLYASVHLPLYCVVHLLCYCCYLLVVFFALTKSFILFRFTLMSYLWDES